MARKQTPAKVYADLERAERRLLLALTKWSKARAAAKRLGAKLDREAFPGEMDVRKMPITPRPWPNRRAEQ